MKELDITWKNVLIVWWALIWRAFVFIYIVGLGVGYVSGYVMGHLNMEVRDIISTVYVLALLFYIIASIFVLRWILLKGFKDHRLVVVKKNKKTKKKAK